MYLTRHRSGEGQRWALDGRPLHEAFTLAGLLAIPRAEIRDLLLAQTRDDGAPGALLPPVEADHEIWAAGVTYERSREAREAESSSRDVYSRVYEAERPELFFKSPGWRVAGHGMPVRVRADSRWNVPEPELTLVVNAHGEIVGFSAGNDVSSRDIEGDNPLYLPQAKIYDGACALGPGLVLADAGALRDLPVRADVLRAGKTIFTGETRTSRMKRPLEELVAYLVRELAFPRGVFLMTGTGIVPPPAFSMEPGDRIRVTIGPLTLENDVDTRPRNLRR
jgi:2-dehydro-3-deoxy-D-arabinonate dehydratase